MKVELYCPHCRHRFTASLDASTAAALDRVAEEGPECALGDGETVEDRLCAALNDQELMRCPDCGQLAMPDEESLGRVTQTMLANW